MDQKNEQDEVEGMEHYSSLLDCSCFLSETDCDDDAVLTANSTT